MKVELLIEKFPWMTWDEPSRSYVVPHTSLLEVVRFLKNDPEFKMDYVSNVAGIDWLSKKEKVKNAEGKEVEVEKPGYLEVVYHFYSMQKKHGPVILRCRTEGRNNPILPSMTPLKIARFFRGAEFQEREIYDLYGIHFSGHPDLRRILMWEGFQDFPMRKDYQAPDDYEWEPTPHDEVVKK